MMNEDGERLEGKQEQQRKWYLGELMIGKEVVEGGGLWEGFPTQGARLSEVSYSGIRGGCREE